MLRFMRRACSRNLPLTYLRMLHIALVRSNLTYASQVWAPSSSGSISKLIIIISTLATKRDLTVSNFYLFPFMNNSTFLFFFVVFRVDYITILFSSSRTYIYLSWLLLCSYLSSLEWSLYWNPILQLYRDLQTSSKKSFSSSPN